MPYRRKPRVLKKKNIKKKTGAKAQSKQIIALSKQIGSLTKSNYETVQTVWSRNNLSVDRTIGGVAAYVCPIPKSMCNCFNQNTLDTNGLADQRLKWADNLVIAAQTYYQKAPIFSSSAAARNSPEATHLGGILKLRLISEEPSFSTYDVFLISPKSRQADQLITDRQLKGMTGGHNPGSAGNLVDRTDYVTHPEVMGSQINKKFWNIDAYKRCNFSHPGGSNLATNVNPSNTNPRNNSVIQEISFKTKPGGVIRCMNQQTYDANLMNYPVSASQIGYVDEKNEKCQFLVIINNGVSTDLETVNLSILCKDYYKMVV